MISKKWRLKCVRNVMLRKLDSKRINTVEQKIETNLLLLHNEDKF